MNDHERQCFTNLSNRIRENEVILHNLSLEIIRHRKVLRRHLSCLEAIRDVLIHRPSSLEVLLQHLQDEEQTGA